MYCRKICYLSLMFSLLGGGVSSAQADDPIGISLSGKMSGCLEAAVSAYPCVFLTPSSYISTYQPLSHSGLLTTGTLFDDDAYATHHSYLPHLSFTHHDSFKSGLRALHRLQGMDLNFKLDRSGAGMNVDMGELEFNVFLKDGENQLLETGFFLGIDTRW